LRFKTSSPVGSEDISSTWSNLAVCGDGYLVQKLAHKYPVVVLGKNAHYINTYVYEKRSVFVPCYVTLSVFSCGSHIELFFILPLNREALWHRATVSSGI